MNCAGTNDTVITISKKTNYDKSSNDKLLSAFRSIIVMQIKTPNRLRDVPSEQVVKLKSKKGVEEKLIKLEAALESERESHEWKCF